MRQGTATKEVRLDEQALRDMRQLTHELTEVLEKISRTALTTLGESKDECTSFIINLRSGSKPLEIQFGGSSGLKMHDDVQRGYYIDPPGVCTPIKPANA